MSVQFILDQCEAALEVIEFNVKGNPTLRNSSLEKLFNTKGYLWLKERELAMGELGQAFSDEKFKEFILSDNLKEKLHQLQAVLSKLRDLDMEEMVEKAQGYLPEDFPIDSYLVPLIKPLENSFVYQIDGKIAVFLYLNPQYTKAEMENIIIHELHHVGLGEIYKAIPSQIENSGLREIFRWTQALGEGYAMLAAAGGVDQHPVFYDSELKNKWDQRMDSFADDFEQVNKFFIKLLKQELNEADAMEKGFEMFGIQGPWYTVGWQVAVTIEKVYGRKSLIECIANPLQQFAMFNNAIKIHNLEQRIVPLGWSGEIINFIEKYGSGLLSF